LAQRPAAIDHVERTGGIQLDVPPEPDYMALVRMTIHSLSQRRDLDDERAQDIVLAVSEACTHVLSARADSEGHGPIQLRWSETDEACLIEVIDSSGRTGDALPDTGAALADPARSALEGDLSLPLVEALVDEVSVTGGADGSSVRMRVLCGPWLPDPV
jgi:anti-sigma regulatory factor (Ser/Thr protein kinase)